MKGKKILSLTLAVLMALAMLALPAYAQTELTEAEEAAWEAALNNDDTVNSPVKVEPRVENMTSAWKEALSSENGKIVLFDSKDPNAEWLGPHDHTGAPSPGIATELAYNEANQSWSFTKNATGRAWYAPNVGTLDYGSVTFDLDVSFKRSAGALTIYTYGKSFHGDDLLTKQYDYSSSLTNKKIKIALEFGSDGTPVFKGEDGTEPRYDTNTKTQNTDGVSTGIGIGFGNAAKGTITINSLVITKEAYLPGIESGLVNTDFFLPDSVDGEDVSWSCSSERVTINGTTASVDNSDMDQVERATLVATVDGREVEFVIYIVPAIKKMVNAGGRSYYVGENITDASFELNGASFENWNAGNNQKLSTTYFKRIDGQVPALHFVGAASAIGSNQAIKQGWSTDEGLYYVSVLAKYVNNNKTGFERSSGGTDFFTDLMAGLGSTRLEIENANLSNNEWKKYEYVVSSTGKVNFRAAYMSSLNKTSFAQVLVCPLSEVPVPEVTPMLGWDNGKFQIDFMFNRNGVEGDCGLYLLPQG